MTRITVRVYARDPISEVGVSSALRPRPEVRVVGPDEDEPPDVVLVIVDAVDEEALNTLRFVRRNGEARVILIASHLDDQDLVRAVESGVVGLVRRVGCHDRPTALGHHRCRRRRGHRSARPARAPARPGRPTAAHRARPAGDHVHRARLTRDRGAQARRRRLGHRADRDEALVLRAHREERAPRRDDATAAPQPLARGRVRDARGTHLSG